MISLVLLHQLFSVVKFTFHICLQSSQALKTFFKKNDLLKVVCHVGNVGQTNYHPDRVELTLVQFPSPEILTTKGFWGHLNIQKETRPACTLYNLLVECRDPCALWSEGVENSLAALSR